MSTSLALSTGSAKGLLSENCKFKISVMFTFITQIIFALSLGVIALLVARKIPVLVVLPEAVETEEEKKRFFRKVFQRNRVAKLKPYTSQEMKEKTTALIQNKKHQIDTDADYWQEITSS